MALPPPEPMPKPLMMLVPYLGVAVAADERDGIALVPSS
jgi:hypothetical protein